MGSAIKNTGVQPLLDGVCADLPNPAEAEVFARDTNLPSSVPRVPLVPAAEAPLVGLAFKLEEGRFGQLTYACLPRDFEEGNLVRMHSDEMEVSRCIA